MKIVADTHTHTLAVDHGYSTLNENANFAAKIGLEFLCMTEHTPLLLGAPTEIHFKNLPSLPRKIAGVYIVSGAEVNVVNSNGDLDLSADILNGLEWIIASMHTLVYAPEDKKAHTKAWLSIAENPSVDVIGHCGDARYPFDHDEALRAFAKNGKIVEINSHSFDQGVRFGSYENCRDIAIKCAEYNIPVVVSSDAHFHENVGNFSNAFSLLKEIDFPKELILNADSKRFTDTLNKINNSNI